MVWGISSDALQLANVVKLEKEKEECGVRSA